MIGGPKRAAEKRKIMASEGGAGGRGGEPKKREKEKKRKENEKRKAEKGREMIEKVKEWRICSSEIKMCSGDKRNKRKTINSLLPSQ